MKEIEETDQCLSPLNQDEIRLVRQKLKEAEMTADQDRYLRSKLSDDSSHLVKENALLNQQVVELQKQLERVRLIYLAVVSMETKGRD